ncbi:MAG TPA: DUF3179 domain-containing (seleno)protein, partial [Nitrososphaeraceae archaeon]
KMLILIVTLSIIGISLVVLIPGMDINSVSISNSTTITESIHPVYTLVGEEENRNIVLPELIVNGGPPPDGIPSIDNPKFIQIQKAEEFLEDSDLVVGLNINGDIRAYPLQILVWHEIVNDKVGNTPVAVTYCPLCFTNQVFNRTMNDGQILEFGTSGKLYNSNLVMYDRTTKSLGVKQWLKE